jgi:hypothetical protein
MIEFTKEEKVLIHQYAKRGDRHWEALSFYAVILLPLLAFAIFGLVRQDVIAMSIAFFGLFLSALWYIFSQGRPSNLFCSICKKLEEAIISK